ncbi:MAG: nucleotide sugar dehydrogenase [Nanoarchaeota archaeon]|nr:nucleotide sugar dehydrogenase [DPANN group archaeon]MBL7116274.1 nucleotide sugar dehydrogenase [Nanoarchaeota archaeon]
MKGFKICVVGLGYVGLPLAIHLAKSFKVYGFDVSEKRIANLSSGIDENGDVSEKELKGANIEYTSDASVIKNCDFVIVAVPTPISTNKKPDLSYLKSASSLVGRNLAKNSIVVFESTVYPGVTEDVCVPVIEKESGLKCGVDWKVGYSPERINPGDKVHTVDKITKVVAGMDKDSLEKIAFVYSKVTDVYKASSIKVAEAAKVIENTQRDLNIALVNELSLIFKRIGIDTLDVLEAAGSKWNFLDFKPGLVGGHCIGVDPYYLTYKAEEVGYIPQVILAGRKINDEMYLEVVRLLCEGLNKHGKAVNGSKILILGVTFKEDVKDSRNSKVADVILELERLGGEVLVNDPYFDEIKFDGLKKKVTPLEDIDKVDAVILASPHKEYKKLSIDDIKKWMKKPVIVDVKGVLGKDECVYRL